MRVRIDRSEISRRQSVLGDHPLVNPAADSADGKGQPERGEEADDADEQTELRGRPRLGGAGGDQEGDD